jgi:predicted nucleic acid-binding protein
MRLVDSSAWIEWFIDSPVGQELAQHVPPQNEWLVPTIVQLELSKWLSRVVNEETADQAIAFTETCVVVQLDTEIALSAAHLCRAFGLAMADAIIYATARAYGADLLTCDRHFEGLPSVLYSPKFKS